MKKHPLFYGLSRLMIRDVPSYGNKLFYSLGFLSMTSFIVLLVTGIVMAFYGPDWWLTASPGKYFRSIHLWATQAFVLFVILHLLVVFLTSGFKKPRRLTWVIGVLMFAFVLAEAEFGYVLRGDFSSQWRALQGADFYNGTGLGYWINNINYRQIYGIHVVVIPLLILGLLSLHYLLVRVLGIAKPYRQDVHKPTVAANHKLLFARGGMLVALLLVLAAVFPSPFLKPDSIRSVTQADPKITAKTMMNEFDRSSDTAGYLDNINPYNFDTRSVFVTGPYAQLAASGSSVNQLDTFNAEPADKQAAQVKQARDYYDNSYPATANSKNPVEQMINPLVHLAAAGLYEPALNAGGQTNYGLRFLADTGVLDDRAQGLGITTEQYGMLREEKGRIPPGAWWLAPIGLLNHTVLSNDDNGDRDGAIILGLFMLLLLAFPFIPILNRIPDWLKVYKLIWR